MLETVSIFDAGRVMCIAPHPDDDVIGCGGTLTSLTSNGSDVKIVYVTSGENGNREIPATTLAGLRELEAQAAAEVMGVSQEALTFLRYKDGGTASRLQIVARQLSKIFSEFNPTAVLIPASQDAHPDHMAANRATKLALSNCSLIEPAKVYTYEVWSDLPAVEHTVDVTQVIDDKVAAMNCHETQIGKYDYVEKILTRASLRSGITGRYAEVFGEEESSMRDECSK